MKKQELGKKVLHKDSLFHSFLKRSLIMFNWSLILTFLLCTQVYAVSYPQVARVDLNLKSTSLKTALSVLEQRSDIRLLYSEDLLPKKEVSMVSKNMPVLDALSEMLKETNLNYRVLDDGLIVIVSRYGILVQDLTISGKVTDSKGAAIPGVSILEKGTTNGVATNTDGNYSITVSGTNSTLIFSSIGYDAKEVPVGNTRIINVMLTESGQGLEEVVVLGYASQQKSDLTGSVATVNGNDIHDLPATSVAQALQGRAPGVQVVTNSGAPGAASDIIIRGGGSVNGMPPLFIVDGVRMGTDYNFNNEDIASIEILKDASAAAIYGAQAAGGVVLISTKRGSGVNQKIKVDLNGSYGIRKALGLPILLDTKDYFTARGAFGYNTSAWGNPDELPNTDWMKVLFRTGVDQNYGASLSGASENANYYISGNYFRQRGVRTYNSFERFALRINSDFKLNKKLTVGETVLISRSYLDPDGLGGSGNYFRTVPSMAVKNPDGSWGGAPTGGYYNGRNQAQQTAGHHGGIGQHKIDGNLYLDYKIVDGFSVRGTFGATLGNMVNSIFDEAYVTGSNSGPAEMTKTFTDIQNYTGNIVANFNKTFGLHDVKALAGYEVYKQDRNLMTGSATEFAVDVTESFFLNTNLASQMVTGGIYPDSRILSQFGRLNYSFNNKYLFTATIRRDGSDRFGPENKWGVFPAFSAGWRISEESFFQNLKGTISSLELRGSYGLLGNIGSIPQFLYQSSFGPQNITSLGDGTRVQAYGRNLSLPNTQIKWEQVQTTDIGVDAALFSNKLTLTLDWYQRSTNDMIYAVPVPLSAGLNGNPVFTNIGKLKNSGFEIGANYRNHFGDFAMNLGLNASFNNNKVVFLAGGPDQAINNGTGGPYLSNTISRTVAGQPMSMFFGYLVDGIFPTDQAVVDHGIIQQLAGAGDLIFHDVNGDGIITDDDRTFIGNPWPKLTYGLNFVLNYKMFDLSLGFYGAQDFDIYNAYKHYANFLAGDYNTTANVFKASYFNGNGLTDAPRLGFTDNNGVYVRDPNANYSKISSYFVEDGSYIKLKNIQFGYNLSDKILSRLKINSVNVYVQATNVFTITKYAGTDPEVIGEGITARGIDNNQRYPQTRTMSVGLKLGF